MDDIKSPSSVTIEDLPRLINEFRQKVQNGMEDPDQFMSFSEIESLWSQLIDDTNVAYKDMLQQLISNTDEKKLNKVKKDSSKPEE